MYFSDDLQVKRQDVAYAACTVTLYTNSYQTRCAENFHRLPQFTSTVCLFQCLSVSLYLYLFLRLFSIHLYLLIPIPSSHCFFFLITFSSLPFPSYSLINLFSAQAPFLSFFFYLFLSLTSSFIFFHYIRSFLPLDTLFSILLLAHFLILPPHPFPHT